MFMEIFIYVIYISTILFVLFVCFLYRTHLHRVIDVILLLVDIQSRAVNIAIQTALVSMDIHSLRMNLGIQRTIHSLLYIPGRSFRFG